MEDEDKGRQLIQHDKNIIVLARLYAHTDWISCMYLAQYSPLPFCVLFYI